MLEAYSKKVEYATEVAEHENDKVRYEKEKLINEKDRKWMRREFHFFTNIQHKLRTPLTLIINSIKELIEEKVILHNNKSLSLI